jgi:hypothetical protein
MPVLEPLNFEQPKNELGLLAEAERQKLLPKNDFSKNNQYSSVNPDALADGDEKGKGTGDYLDVYNNAAGAIQDIRERKALIVSNEYQVSKPYTTPTA